MAADTVLGVFDREHLADALAALHRGGYGTNIRVMDAARGELAGQLRRAGITEPPVLDAATRLLVMVFAPSRVSPVVDLLRRRGARAIHVVEHTSDSLSATALGFTFSPRSRARPLPGEVDPTQPGDHA